MELAFHGQQDPSKTEQQAIQDTMQLMLTCPSWSITRHNHALFSNVIDGILLRNSIPATQRGGWVGRGVGHSTTEAIGVRAMSTIWLSDRFTYFISVK